LSTFGVSVKFWNDKSANWEKIGLQLATEKYMVSILTPSNSHPFEVVVSLSVTCGS